MATPRNPLDIYVSYTYHFELHAHHSWDELKKQINTVSDESTSRRDSGVTLLINTRKDMHTTIDGVNFTQIASQAGDTPGISQGEVTMTITEPGGAFFAEKLKKHCDKNQVGGPYGLLFALKIVFVGRLQDNSIDILGSRIIPMTLLNMSARFDVKGGEYHPVFCINSDILQATNPFGQIVGKSNRNVSFYARTIKEACRELESKLNSNYEETYTTEVENCVSAKPLNFKINLLDDRIDGVIDLASKNSFAPNEKNSFTFTQDVTIIDMVRAIVNSSSELNKTIGDGHDAVTKQFQPGVKLITITPSFWPGDTASNVEIHVNLYEGDGKPVPDNLYEFNYFFSGAGENVDVLDFEMQFAQFALFLVDNSSSYGTQLNTNMTASIPDDDKAFVTKNVITPDKTMSSLTNVPIEKRCINAQQNDTAVLPTMVAENRLLNIPPRAAADFRVAFSTYARTGAATNNQVSFLIRGHLDILNRSIGYPDGSVFAQGTENVLWIKVNIFDQQGDPFYYTGYYRLMQIQNVFNGGKFTQLLTVLMCDDGAPSTVDTSVTPTSGATAATPPEAVGPPLPPTVAPANAPAGTTVSQFVSNAGKAATGIVRNVRR